MSLLEIKGMINDLGQTWSEFKSAQEQKIKDVANDPLLNEKIGKLNNRIDTIQSQISAVSNAKSRPQLLDGSSDFNSSEMEHKSQFVSYLRKGNEAGLRDLEKKSFLSVADNDGGYLASRPLMNYVSKEINSYSPMRRLANVTEVMGDTLEIITDAENASSGWTLETDARNNSAAAKLNKTVIELHELFAQPKATQKLVDDAAIDIEAWIAERIAESFTAMENAAFISGDGAGKPKGILSYENGIGFDKIEHISASDLTFDTIMNLCYALKEQHAVKAKFLMNRSVIHALRTLKNPTTGEYVWQMGVSDNPVETILGCEVVSSADMPMVDSSLPIIAFGDFKSAYQIADRQGIRILRDPFTEKPFVKFYATKRVGGAVVNGNAIKLLKLA